MSVEQTRQQAKDENTAPEILAELANSEDKLTRQYLASNPNTPTKILLNLGAEFPQELLNNPIFDLLLLENSNFINELPINTLQKIISLRDISLAKSFIDAAMNHRKDFSMLFAIVRHPNTSSIYLDLITQEKFSHHIIAEFIACHPNAKTSTLAKLIEVKEYRVFINLASNTNTPKNILHWLTNNSNLSQIKETHIYGTGIKVLVASNTNTSTKTLNELSDCIDRGIHQNKNKKGIIGIKVRKAVAFNPSTSLETLKKLAKNEIFDIDIRTAVVVHPKINLDSLIALNVASNQESITLIWMGKQIDTPINVLEQLIVEDVSYRTKTPEVIVKDVSYKTRILDWQLIWAAVSSNPITPGYLLEKLYCINNFGYKYLLIGQHPNTPSKLLEEICSRCSYLPYRMLYARNQNLSIKIKKQMEDNPGHL